jgi:uncharacterized protein YndB with AHSA1/START domain
MTDINHETFTITRTYEKCIAHVWSAWSDRAKKWRWLRSDDAVPADFLFDFRVGGEERSSFTSPMGSHENHTVYFDIAEENHIVYSYSMALNGRIHSVSVASVTFEDAGGGTKMTYVEQITLIGESDGAEGRKHGWTALFESLDTVLRAEMA